MSTVLVPGKVCNNFSRLWVRKQLTYFRLFDRAQAGVVSDLDVHRACSVRVDNDNNNVHRLLWRNMFSPVARLSESTLQVPWEDFIVSRSEAASELNVQHDTGNILQIIENMFQVADLNKDGVLQRHEHIRLMSLLGLTSTQAMVSFSNIDVNKDEIISASEFRDAMLVFFFQSTDGRFSKVMGELDQAELLGRIDLLPRLVETRLSPDAPIESKLQKTNFGKQILTGSGRVSYKREMKDKDDM